MTPDALAQSVVLTIKAAVATATGPLLERLAASEARTAELRERIAGIEAKSQPIDVAEVLTPLRDRLVAIETTVARPNEAGAAVEALRKSFDEALDRIGQLRERVATIEAKPDPVFPPIAPPKSYDADVDGLKKALDDVSGRVGDLRERVAVVETRAPVPGPAGAPGVDGKNGVDGIGWDDLTVEHDGERTFTFKSIRGERVKEHGSFVVPAMIYRGIFSEGKSYQPGDVITWAGSAWHCRKVTSLSPEHVSRDPVSGLAGGPQGKDFWSLMVKSGRDGGKATPVIPDAPIAPAVVKLR